MPTKQVSPLDIAHFRFGLIAPVVQKRFPDPSAMAYYRRVTEEPIELPDGTTFKFSPGTLQKWFCYYNRSGIEERRICPPRALSTDITSTLSGTARFLSFVISIRYRSPLSMNGFISF